MLPTRRVFDINNPRPDGTMVLINVCYSTSVSNNNFLYNVFATNKAGKYRRGHNCCQLFVTDKGYFYVVPMKSKFEVLQVVKLFYKEVWASEAIISDAARKHSSK